jgi:EpsI family protein
MSKIQINAITKAAAIFACLCVLLLVGSMAKPRYVRAGRIIEDFKSIPLQCGPWRSDDVMSRVKEVEGLPTSSVLDRVYSSSKGDDAVLTIVYASSFGDLHQPENCLRGQGWTTKDQSKITVRPVKGIPFDAMVTWMSNEEDGREQIALYWFDAKGTKSTMLPSYKIKMQLLRMMGRTTDGVALVRVLVPIRSDNRDAAAQAAASFAENVSPFIDAMMAVTPRFEKSKS